MPPPLGVGYVMNMFMFAPRKIVAGKGKTCKGKMPFGGWLTSRLNAPWNYRSSSSGGL